MIAASDGVHPEFFVNAKIFVTGDMSFHSNILQLQIRTLIQRSLLRAEICLPWWGTWESAEPCESLHLISPPDFVVPSLQREAVINGNTYRMQCQRSAAFLLLIWVL